MPGDIFVKKEMLHFSFPLSLVL
ncbi:hypothetical protein ACSE3M_03120 [Bacillus velezensis]